MYLRFYFLKQSHQFGLINLCNLGFMLANGFNWNEVDYLVVV